MTPSEINDNVSREEFQISKMAGKASSNRSNSTHITMVGGSSSRHHNEKIL
jgi:hypothetical protein